MGRSRTTLRLHNDLLDYAIHIQKEQHLSSIAAAVNWILGDHRKRQPSYLATTRKPSTNQEPCAPPATPTVQASEPQASHAISSDHDLNGHFNIRVKDLLAPGVYIWKRGDEVLYAGSSSAVLRRVCTRGHHVLDNRDKFLDSDEIEFVFCDSAAEAQRLEARIIRRLCPKYNKQGNPDWCECGRCKYERQVALGIS